MTASVAEIIDRVRRLITLPPDDTLFNSADFLAFINECMIEKIYPRVMKIRDDYFLVRDVFPLQNSSAQDLYPTGVMPIPARAWGNTLREIKYIDNSGNYYKVNPYYLENLDLYQTRNLALSSQYQKGFIPFNSGIKLIPPPLQDTGSIEMHYIITPSIIYTITQTNPAITDLYIPITNIVFNQSTNVCTYTVPTTSNISSNIMIGDTTSPFYTGVNSTGLYDIYNSLTGMILATNLPLFRAGSITFTGTSTVQIGTLILNPNITEITNFQSGGYPVFPAPYSADLFLIPSGFTPFTTLIPVLDNLLAYEVAIKVLSAQGYVEELQTFMAQHGDMRKDLLSQIDMRVDCEPHVISSYRGIRASILYSNFRRRRF